MNRLGDVYFSNIGIHIKGVQGLWDFPALKNTGTDWNDEDYTEAASRLQDFQYEPRKITIDCFVYADNWTALDGKLASIMNTLNYSGLKMLVLSDYSLRGYMVRMAKSTIMEPHRYFRAGQSVATFKIQFEEPQPFNVQCSFFYDESKLGTYIFVNISKLSKSLSLGSTEQRYVRVCFLDQQTAVNLEQDDYEYEGMYAVTANNPYPLVILGETDTVEDIELAAEIEPVGIAAADYFLRNGSITFTLS